MTKNLPKSTHPKRKNETSDGSKLGPVDRIVQTLPLTLPASLAAFSTVAVFLLVIGELSNILIWPFGLLAAFLIFRTVYASSKNITRPGTVKEQRLIDYLVLLFVIVWVVFNAAFTSQNIFVYRDPAINSVAAEWITEHDSLEIPDPNVFGLVEGLGSNSAGFVENIRDASNIQAQGLHLLPVLTGLAGRVLGDVRMYNFAPIFGGIALLALYGVARLLARPRWAAIATLGFGASLPLIHFSRDTYSEPLSAALIFGSIGLLLAAKRTAATGLWIAAGLTAGAAALTRADGLLVVAVLFAFAIIDLSLSQSSQRRTALTNVGLMAVAAAIASVIGWVDVSTLSNAYYIVHGVQVRQLFYLLVAIVLVGAITIALFWKTKILNSLDKITLHWRPIVACLFVVVLFTALASRPFWQVSHNPDNAAEGVAYIGSLQIQEGEKYDPTRDYAEHTVNWMVWYLGLGMCVLALAGLSIAAYRSMRDKDLKYIPPLMLVVGASALFMVEVGISPDQIWASRRFLPITIPGIALFAAVALDKIGTYRVNRHRVGLFLALGAGVLIIAQPLTIASRFLRTRTYFPELAQVESVCRALPPRAAVVWAGPDSKNSIQTVRSFCEVPAQTLVEPTTDSLAEVAQNAKINNYRPIIVVTGSNLDHLPEISMNGLVEVSNATIEIIPGSLEGLPYQREKSSRSIRIGELSGDGSIMKLNTN